jgi:arylsulfatase A-like enzyme
MVDGAGQDRPNVILIVSDDHGYADRAALGIHPELNTPALDRIAAEGVSCDSAYVTAPICSPSRAAIISGRYQQRWGARWFDTSAFPPDGASLAEQFAELGYATGYFGKVHYGPEKPGDRACPDQHGFAESLYGLAGLSMGRLHYQHHSRAAAEQYGPDGIRVHGRAGCAGARIRGQAQRRAILRNAGLQRRTQFLLAAAGRGIAASRSGRALGLG